MRQNKRNQRGEQDASERNQASKSKRGDCHGSGDCKRNQAAYGADNCGADWNEQAVKKGASYLKLTSFSRDGLIRQLEHDGFTREQAEYGATKNGY